MYYAGIENEYNYLKTKTDESSTYLYNPSNT